MAIEERISDLHKRVEGLEGAVAFLITFVPEEAFVALADAVPRPLLCEMIRCRSGETNVHIEDGVVFEKRHTVARWTRDDLRDGPARELVVKLIEGGVRLRFWA